MTLRAGRGGQHIIQAHGADERGPFKGYSDVVDPYSSKTLPQVRTPRGFRPIYVGVPCIRELRLTLWGPIGSPGVYLRRLTLSRVVAVNGGALGARGFVTGDPGELTDYGLEPLFSDPDSSGLGWAASSRGAGPYTVGYAFMFNKWTPDYRLEADPNEVPTGYALPQRWKLELFLPGWGWVTADERLSPSGALLNTWLTLR